MLERFIIITCLFALLGGGSARCSGRAVMSYVYLMAEYAFDMPASDTASHDAGLRLAMERQQADLRRVKTYLAFTLALSALLTMLYLLHAHRLRRCNTALARRICEQVGKEEQLSRLGRGAPEALPAAPEPADPPDILPSELYLRLDRLMADELLFTNAELSRAEVAARLGTNVAYLYNALREIRGQQPFTDYLNSYRLNYACKLLADDPGRSIESIALESGFNSRQTFYRIFKKQFGLTPLAYRKSIVRNC